MSHKNKFHENGFDSFKEMSLTYLKEDNFLLWWARMITVSKKQNELLTLQEENLCEARPVAQGVSPKNGYLGDSYQSVTRPHIVVATRTV